MPKSVEALEAQLRTLDKAHESLRDYATQKIIAEILLAILAEMQEARKK